MKYLTLFKRYRAQSFAYIDVRLFNYLTYLDLGPPVPAGTLGDEQSPLLAVTSNRLGLLPGIFVIFGCDAHQIFAKIAADRPRQPAYGIKLMSSRVS